MRMTRRLVPLVLIAFSPLALADSVSGFCESGGKRLEFTDGIAFHDARKADGALVTAIHLTAGRLDRAALAKCRECATELPESTFMSPRSPLFQAQRAATAAGWAELQHVGGDYDWTSVVSIMYLSDKGVLTGIDTSYVVVEWSDRSDTRVSGKVITGEVHEGYEAGANCDVRFDLAVGWPK